MAIHSPEFKKKRRRRMKNYTISILVILTVLVSVSSYISHREKFLISELEVSGNSVTSSEEIKEVVKKELEGKYFWLYPRSNSFLYSRDGIKNSVFSEIPRISTINLRTTENNILEVKVAERTPAALYCEDISNVTDPSSCYFLDENGFIFSVAPSFSGDVYFLFSQKQTLKEPLKKQFLPQADFRELTEFLKRLEVLGVENRAFETDIEDRRHYIILENLGKIVWSSEDDLGLIAMNLESFLLDEAILSQEDFFDRVIEIDLSTNNKIHWKMDE